MQLVYINSLSFYFWTGASPPKDFLFYKSRTVTQTSPVQSGCRETASQSYQNLQSEAGIDHPSDVIKVCPQW